MANPTMSPAASRNARARAVLVIAASALALVAGLLVLPNAADASPQSTAAPLATPTTCDNGYGCPTSSTQGAINPTCSLSTTSATPGTKITATINDVPAGSEISLLFDGNEVGTKTADANGSAVMSFTVPNTTPSKGHTVVFSGAGFSCDATGGAGFEVLAAAGNRGGGGGLSNTGIEVALYLAIALVLIVAGWQLTRVAQARRRRIARQRKSASRHAVRR
jgi:hypothetical protein